MPRPFPPEWLPALHPRRGGAVPPPAAYSGGSGLDCVEAARMVVALADPARGGFRHPRFALAVRTRIAAADDEVYRRVHATLSGLRRLGRAEDTVIAYLLPTETEWVDEVCALPPAGAFHAGLIRCSVHTPEQIRMPGFVASRPSDLLDPGTLATLAEGVGPHLAVLLERLLPELTRVRHRRMLFQALGHLPGDLAYTTLLRAHGDREGSVVLNEATRRFPQRAARLLAADDSESARLLLRAHLLAFPSLQDDRLRARAGLRGRLRPVRPAELPSVLRAPGTPRAWADPALLPEIRWRTKERVLPPEAVARLQDLLAHGAGAEVEAVREAVDARSLAGFGWAQFEAWRAAGLPAREVWALTCLARIGDDTTARLLAPVVRAWPGQRCHSYAVAGLDVLAGIGTRTALGLLAEIAVLARYKALRRCARERLARVAEAAGLTADRLADRLVPTLGLSRDGEARLGGAVLDFGPFLRVHVPGERPRPGPEPPVPGPGDDPGRLARGARLLEADVRLVFAAEARWLERAMLGHRLWTPAEFRTLAAHPLVGPLVRRLVWTCPGGEFRVTGEGLCTGFRGEPVALNGPVSLPHPVGLGASAREWRAALDGVVQPFPQLERPIARLGEDERSAVRLHRFEGGTARINRLLTLMSRGWHGGGRRDGLEDRLTRPLPGGGRVVVEFAPGLPHSRAADLRNQRVTGVLIEGAPEPVFGILDPVTASELLTDLAWVTGR